MSSRRVWQLAAIWVALAGVGCGLNAQSNYRHLRQDLVRRDFAAADRYVTSMRDSFYGGHNALLYAMDRSMVLHLGGHYQQSNACLEQAKQIAERLWTQSISQNAAAWITTDEAMPYQGEDFEKVMLHVVGALNYLAEGAYGEAQVETRQASERLALLASKQQGTDSSYQDDAFAHWLSGLLYEATANEPGALGDAWIDYRRALEVYEKSYNPRYGTPVPQQLVADSLRVLEALGGEFRAPLAALKQRYPHVPYATRQATADAGRVVLIHSTGEAPYKTDAFWTVPVGYNILRIGYPVFVPKPHAIVQARLRVRPKLTVNAEAGPAIERGSAEVVATGELAEDLTAIAVQNLADHMDGIKVRAIARAVTKFTAGAALQVVGATQGGGKGALMEVVGLAFNTSNAIIEHADKRSWLTLPAQLSLTQAFVPAGYVTCDIDFLDAYGRTLQQASLAGYVPPGGTLFLSTRTFL